MEASKRERIFLLGVVPILAAIIGSVATVLVGHYVGDSRPSDAIIAIVQDKSLMPIDKEKLIQLVNAGSDHFYNILGTVVGMLSLFVGITSWAVADWIRKW